MLRLSVLLLSAAALGYEILLMRLFSVVQWHHFAAMIISLALLGYGASGTFLSLLRPRLERRFAAAYVLNGALFGLLAPLVFAVAQRLPVRPLELVWDVGAFNVLFAVYLLLALPFFCVANCIGLALGRYRRQIPSLYRADLIGAGLGAAGVVLALFVLRPEIFLRLVGSLGCLGAAVALFDPSLAVGGVGARRRRLPLIALVLAATAVPWGIGPDWLRPRPSEYKGLARALLVPETRVIEERSSPLGQLTVVTSRRIPFRHAPGLSLACGCEVPEQIGIFTDGDALTVVDQVEDPASDGLRYLEYLPTAAPYSVLERPRVLVLGAGGGTEVMSALRHRARYVDAVELDPHMGELAATYGHFADREEVSVHVAEARAFVERSGERWDLVQIALLDSFAAAAAGTHGQSESYLYTVEALELLYDHLRPGGILSITRWLRVPPREGLKLFATALVTLERSGVAEPGASLALLRTWNTSTLLVKRGRLSDRDTERLRRFGDLRFFDVAYYPGLERADANRFNQLAEPYFYDGARALVADRSAFLDAYKFNLEPATDDRPYFFHFFDWRTLPEILELRRAGGVTLVEWGYLLLVATLLQALVAGLVLILLPLLARRRRLRRPGLLWVAVYFAILGSAFLFLEIAFIQRLTLFLGHPLYAVALVLGTFLFFSGLGSGWSRRLERRYERGGRRRLRFLELVALAIALLALLDLFLFLPLLGELVGLPQAVRVLLAAVLIAPLAAFMGMPFPIALERAGGLNPDWIPWAWGLNGCASVLAAVLATLLAVHLGFSVVVLAASGLYLLAAACGRGLENGREVGGEGVLA